MKARKNRSRDGCDACDAQKEGASAGEQPAPKVHVIGTGEVRFEPSSDMLIEPGRAVHYIGATPGDEITRAVREIEATLKNLPTISAAPPPPLAAPSGPMETVKWLENQIKQRNPDEMPSQFARRIAPIMAAAHKRGEVKKVWASRSIENNISKLKLWPK